MDSNQDEAGWFCAISAGVGDTSWGLHTEVVTRRTQQSGDFKTQFSHREDPSSEAVEPQLAYSCSCVNRKLKENNFPQFSGGFLTIQKNQKSPWCLETNIHV